MAKPSTSQWDFGELFVAESRAPERKILSVTELTAQIRRLLEQQVGQVWVTGEVSNLRHQSSGHIYFTLKDPDTELSCVLFRGEAPAERALVQEGRKVTLQGDLRVYEKRGQYQLSVTRVELDGMGALQAAFEKLKQKLKAEGLFAPERKRPLPRYPQRIGLVTSPTGAAIRDVLHVIGRRDAGLKIILAPCRVQGSGAAAEIAQAIRLLNEFHARMRASAPLDLILVTRGGGSLEDLWAFNEEAVARAIFDASVPVVSAVGHEIDFTISDFVADLRAATPSAAAELITEGVFSSTAFIADSGRRLRQLAGQQLADKRQLLAHGAQRLARLHPRRRFNDWLQRLDEVQAGLLRCARQGTRQQRIRWQNLADRLARVRPAFGLKQRQEALRLAQQRLGEQALRQLDRTRNQFKSLQARLGLLGPEQVLARGYSITMDDQTGKVLRSAHEVKVAQRVRTRLKSGQVISRVESRENREPN